MPHVTLSKKFLTLLLAALTISVASAQERHITPVKPETNKVLTPAKGTSEDVIKRYLAGDTTSAREIERRDSLKRVYPHYPRLTDITFGINVLDPFLMAFGQSYGSVDLSATLNMWNRLQPVLELGVGFAHDKPEDMNYTYHTSPAPYVKLGANYNFTFKSHPRHQAIVGLRLGASAFNFDVRDVTVTDGYWQQSEQFTIKGVSSNALWAEFVAGLRVHVWRDISLGWQLKYHGVLSYKKTEHGSPWFIPGYGKRTGSLAAGFSVYYTIPLNLHKWPKPEEKDKKK